MIKKFESFVSENSGEQKYLELTDKFIDIVTKEGVTPVDGVYECHEWVSHVETMPGVNAYLFDEDKWDAFDAARADMGAIMKKYGKGWYFDYTMGHSFIEVDGIFVDLTLDSIGVSFDDVQKICRIFSEADMFHN